MNKPQRILSPHRFARLIAWAQKMLAWMTLVMFTPAAINRRHIRQRYGFISLDRVERFVRALAIVRAIQLTHLRPHPRRTLCNSAPAGFRRRVVRGAYLRSIAGSRFRKALKHRDVGARLQRLASALADINAFARRYLVPVARRRLTRLRPVILVAPAVEDVISCLLAPRRAPDSS